VRRRRQATVRDSIIVRVAAVLAKFEGDVPKALDAVVAAGTAQHEKDKADSKAAAAAAAAEATAAADRAAAGKSAGPAAAAAAAAASQAAEKAAQAAAAAEEAESAFTAEKFKEALLVSVGACPPS
jgi:activator of HSP90 ATPase